MIDQETESLISPRFVSRFSLRNSIPNVHMPFALDRLLPPYLPDKETAKLPLERESLLLHQFITQMSRRASIESFNAWVKYHLPNTITSTNVTVTGSKTVPDTTVTFRDVKIEGFPKIGDKPLFPADAIRLGMTYGFTITAMKCCNGVPQSPTTIATIPIMKGSDLCWLSDMDDSKRVNVAREQPRDPQGYFVVAGNERAVMSQDKLVKNELFTKVAKDHLICQMTCVDVQSMLTQMLMKVKGGPIMMTATTVKNAPTQRAMFGSGGKALPIDVLLYVPILWGNSPLTGETAAGDLKKIVDYAKFVVKTHIPESFRDQAMALLGISIMEVAKTMPAGEGILGNAKKVIASINTKMMIEGIFSHVPDPAAKKFLFTQMLTRLLKVHLGVLPITDMNAWANKRMEFPSAEMDRLFSGMLSTELQTWAANTSSATLPIELKKITSVFRKSFTGPSWGRPTGKTKDDMTATVAHDSLMATVSQQMRMSTQAQKRASQQAPRQVKYDQYGLVCPFESPESESIGLTKNLSIGAWVSIQHRRGDLIEYVLSIVRGSGGGAAAAGATAGSSGTEVQIIVSGVPIGKFPRDESFGKLWMALKTHPLYFDVCINDNVTEGCIELFGDGGRLCRPLIKVVDGVIPFTEGDWKVEKFMDLVQRGLVEFVHPKEYKDSMRVCPNPADLPDHKALLEKASKRFPDMKRPEEGFGDEDLSLWLALAEGPFTHSEIHPSVIFGACASLIPWANHNKPARICFQAGMTKQTPGSNIVNTTELTGLMKSLVASASPVCMTDTSEALGITECPAGGYPLVAMLAGDCNNEDGIIAKIEFMYENMVLVKRESHVIKLENMMHTGTFEISDSRMASLHRDGALAGFPRVGTWLKERDCIAYLVSATSRIPQPQFMSQYDSGFVENVEIFSPQGENTKQATAVVTIVQLRHQGMGDKMTTRISQKGVIGKMMWAKDMPRTVDGIVPDFIVNPASITSRITICQLYETFLTLSGMIKGEKIDATPFNEKKLLKYVNDAKALYADWGIPPDHRFDFVTADGIPLKNKVFMGHCYYQSLKHHAKDKIQCRDYGQVYQITMQPKKGRSNEGGIRFGYMEANAVMSSGASAFLRERLRDSSDLAIVVMCKNCGIIASPHASEVSCRQCLTRERENFLSVKLPYSLLLLRMMLKGLCINLNISLKQVE